MDKIGPFIRSMEDYERWAEYNAQELRQRMCIIRVDRVACRGLAWVEDGNLHFIVAAENAHLWPGAIVYTTEAPLYPVRY